jgi:hypothetical protein
MVVEVNVYCLSWLAAFTPDVSMLPPDTLFAETTEPGQEQEWDFAIEALPDSASYIHCGGIEDFYEMEMMDVGEAESAETAWHTGEQGATGEASAGRIRRGQEAAAPERDSLHVQQAQHDAFRAGEPAPPDAALHTVRGDRRR